MHLCWQTPLEEAGYLVCDKHNFAVHCTQENMLSLANYLHRAFLPSKQEHQEQVCTPLSASTAEPAWSSRDSASVSAVTPPSRCCTSRRRRRPSTSTSSLIEFSCCSAKAHVASLLNKTAATAGLLLTSKQSKARCCRFRQQYGHLLVPTAFTSSLC